MIPRTRGNHPTLTLALGELCDQIQAAANLEGAGRVVVLVFDPDATPDPLVEQRVVQERRRPHVGVYACLRGNDIIECRRLHAPNYLRVITPECTTDMTLKLTETAR